MPETVVLKHQRWSSSASSVKVQGLPVLHVMKSDLLADLHDKKGGISAARIYLQYSNGNGENAYCVILHERQYRLPSQAHTRTRA